MNAHAKSAPGNVTSLPTPELSPAQIARSERNSVGFLALEAEIHDLRHMAAITSDLFERFFSIEYAKKLDDDRIAFQTTEDETEQLMYAIYAVARMANQLREHHLGISFSDPGAN